MSLLTVSNLGKSYRQYHSEWQRFARWFGIPSRPAHEHWVVRGVSFDVLPGEKIGILGKNGAGKSTLLKMITGTLQPSEGHVSVRGRVAAILELGMGFNPELTGRQNVFHAAGLMGFNQQQIEEVVEEIQHFADIGEYFDQPVRIYSSGMQSRVSFAVATSFHSDILIIDEALAVGDAAFQRKCFRRLEELCDKGTALLFVSHDIESIKKICQKAVHIEAGSLVEVGEAKPVCDRYEKALFSKTSAISESATPMPIMDAGLVSDCELSYGDGRAIIRDVALANSSGMSANVLRCNETMKIVFTVDFHQTVRNPVFTCLVKTREGIAIFGTDSAFLKQEILAVDAGNSVQVEFAFKAALLPGIYYINCGVRDPSESDTDFLHRRVDVAMFRVTSSESSTALAGLTDLQAVVSVQATHG
ncbi:ABC transporter ATP-binding protein [Pseudomonas sp. GCEP-101]|uniref:ABC transporter ATP-binding protein n=1 Tax=Pseudomonas sp. GCEP-101 TaxID=2974552 RepID=UPI00223B3362|nr:ABC transporter ATP-binding protein [Pseudomonas sp. GCEP-101]